MNTSLFRFKKRLILLSAFLFFACTDQDIDGLNKTVEVKNIDAPLNSEMRDTPLLTLGELISAEDVKNALSEAVSNNDESAIEFWQKQLLDAAEQVNLRDNERALITGSQGLVFLRFQGMKTNYQNAFEDAFFNFGDVNAVYAQYPAFQDMHKASQKLVEKRDVLIAAKAKELSDFDGDPLIEARRQWQIVMQSARQ